MKDLSKFYKPFLHLILVIACLSFLRAFGTLTLPSFTEDIIDIGISRGGIEESYPKVITGESYGLIAYLSDEVAQLYEPSNDGVNINKKIFTGDLTNTYVLKEKTALNDEIENMFISLYGYAISTGQVQLSDEMVAMLQSIAQTNSQNESGEVPEQVSSMILLEATKHEYSKLGYDFDYARLNYLLVSGGQMLLFALFVVAVVVCTNYTSSYVSTMVARNIRHALYEKTLKLSSKELEKFSTASLITRTTNDVVQITNATNMVFQIALYAPILGVWGIIKSYSTAPNLVWINAVSVAAILIIIFAIMSIAFPKFKMIQKLIDRLNLVTREMLTGNLVVRAFVQEKKVEKRFEGANTDVFKTNSTLGYIMSSIFPIIILTMNITVLAVVFFGASDVEAGFMNIGGVFAYMQYSINIIFAFIMLSMISFQLPRALVSAKRVAEVLNEDISIHDGDKEVTANDGVIEFKNVSFVYDDKHSDEAEKVLDNISFTARPNEVTAIIGSTGSGKSTIVSLIPRFYDVSEGEILIDGVNVKDYKIKTLRDKLAIVAQKAFLFSGTIESNITYAKDLADEEIRKVAEISESLKFIEEKEEGFKSIITQGGKNVSGGQRQRLSIARALAKGANILVFDDSFSALDYKTDFNLRQNIKTHMKDTTVIIVAQRISTIKEADQIIVLDDGKVVDIGKHDYLVENCDVYKEIVNSQLEKGEE